MIARYDIEETYNCEEGFVDTAHRLENFREEMYGRCKKAPSTLSNELL